MSTEAARTARELQMLEQLVDCAHALGMVFGAATKAEIEARRTPDNLDAFQKCFQAVRMGIRLCMALSAGTPIAATAAASGPAAPAERPEALDREQLERASRGNADALERERDRDYEPVSLPKFLATLGVVARDAARLDGLPAQAKQVLPALQTLLAQARGDLAETSPTRAVGVAALARPGTGRTRDRLLGSAAAPPGPGPRAPRPWSGFG